MFRKDTHIHFVGIGGVGMAGIAEVLITLGYLVSGSDLQAGAMTKHLADLGAQIFVGHAAENVSANVSVVVVSSAVAVSNVEVLAAKARSIPVIPRAEMLAELMRMKYGVAVGGAHGKTTTTTMVSRVLTEAGFDPTVIIGGRILSQASGAKLGSGKYLVAEADESDGSFNLLRPAIAVVTNIDAEHMSHYGSFEALEAAFAQFMSAVPFYGLVVGCLDDPVVRKLSADLPRRFVGYGLETECTVGASNVSISRNASTFDLILRGEKVASIALPVPGEHMVRNALAAVAVGLELGAELNDIVRALETFPGVARRSEVVGTVGGITIIDDYGHHPAEIRATLKAIRSAYVTGEERLTVLFQPHRYSRSIELFDEFLTAFDDADTVYVSEIYSAGEAPIDGVSGEIMARALKHERAKFVPEFSHCIEELCARARPGDVILTLGAGNVGQWSRRIADQLQNQMAASEQPQADFNKGTAKVANGESVWR